MCCEAKQELHCPKCKACPSDFTIRSSTFWKDADIICKCGNIVDSMYCFHCLDGGKKELAEYRKVCNNEVVYYAVDYTLFE